MSENPFHRQQAFEHHVSIEPRSIEQKDREPKGVVRVLDTDALEQIIEQCDAKGQMRFQRPDEGGVFTYFYPEDVFDARLRDRNTYSVVEEDGMIVGIGKLTKLLNEKNDIRVIASVSVDSDYQKRGYARQILDQMFRMAKENGWILVSSGYSNEGKEKLKKIDLELANKYGVKFLDEEEWARVGWTLE